MPGSPQENGVRGNAGWAEALAAVQHGLTHGRRLLMEDASGKVHALLLLPIALQKDNIVQVGSVIDSYQYTVCDTVAAFALDPHKEGSMHRQACETGCLSSCSHWQLLGDGASQVTALSVQVLQWCHQFVLAGEAFSGCPGNLRDELATLGYKQHRSEHAANMESLCGVLDKERWRPAQLPSGATCSGP